MGEPLSLAMLHRGLMLRRGWSVGWCPRVLPADDRAWPAVALHTSESVSSLVSRCPQLSYVSVMLHACRGITLVALGKVQMSRGLLILNLKALLSV